MATSTEETQVTRRSYRFRLRNVLIGLTLAAACLGGWVYFMRQRAATNRERAVAGERAVEKAVVAIQFVGLRVKIVSFQQRYPTWLERLFNDPGPPDDPVRIFKVHDTGTYKVSDAGMDYYDEDTTVPELYFCDNNLTDAGLKHLKSQSKLEIFFLVNVNITDAGIKHLQGLTTLKELHLSGTMISDAGLKYLEGMTKLEELTLYDTNVTDEGVEKLQKALPNCKIIPR